MTIKLPPTLTKDWEATQEFRRAEKGEWYYHDGRTIRWALDRPSTHYHVIIRKKFKWPKWIKARWLYCYNQEDGGHWAVTNTKPKTSHTRNGCYTSQIRATRIILNEGLLDTTQLPNPKRGTLYENPNV